MARSRANSTTIGDKIMNSGLARTTFFGIVGATALLVGCGGGGGGGGGSTGLTYNGNTDPVVITSANAQAVGVSVAENVSEAVDAESTVGSNPFAAVINLNTANSPLSRKITEISRQVLANARASNLPVGVTYTSDQLNAEIGDTFFCGGSVSISDALFNGSSESGTMTFNNLCFDISYIDSMETGELVMNGRVTISVSGTTETTSYSNFTVTYQGETFTFSGTEVCSTVYPYDCSTLYVGGDGETYMASDVNVYGDDTTGYYVSATFFDPSLGAVEVSTSAPITFCGTGRPNGGTINFTGAGGTYGSITFRSDCLGYDGSYYDGSAAGTFSGTWT